MKASYIEVDGEGRAVYKQPITQTGDYNKQSKKGKVSLYHNPAGGYMTLNEEQRAEFKVDLYEALKVVYDGKAALNVLTFDQVRANSEK